MVNMKKVLKGKIPNLVAKRSKAGIGAFANREFKRSDFIAEYTGRKIKDADADKSNSVYLMAYQDGYTIDGAPKTNKARYINHSCDPNAFCCLEDGKLNIRARRRIHVGEEVTFNYGKEYFQDIISKKGCRCGHCSGKVGAPFLGNKKTRRAKRK
jgi:SET domain-containing protein